MPKSKNEFSVIYLREQKFSDELACVWGKFVTHVGKFVMHVLLSTNI